MGDDACGEMMSLNKAVGPSERQEIHGMIKHTEKQFRKNFVPGKTL
jgi:hypothetical protein